MAIRNGRNRLMIGKMIIFFSFFFLTFNVVSNQEKKLSVCVWRNKGAAGDAFFFCFFLFCFVFFALPMFSSSNKKKRKKKERNFQRHLLCRHRIVKPLAHKKKRKKYLKKRTLDLPPFCFVFLYFLSSWFFFSVVPNFTEFYRVFKDLFLFLLNCIEFYWVLPSFTEFLRIFSY